MSNIKWVDEALYFLIEFLDELKDDDEFMAEDIRYASEDFVTKPKNARSWGSVMLRAQKEGYIMGVGYDKVKNVNAHRTPAKLWTKGPALIDDSFGDDDWEEMGGIDPALAPNHDWDSDPVGFR